MPRYIVISRVKNTLNLTIKTQDQVLTARHEPIIVYIIIKIVGEIVSIPIYMYTFRLHVVAVRVVML